MKLVILGGAGVRTVFFTNGVAEKADIMGITELVLFDTDEKKLAIMGALSKYAAQKANPGLKVSTATDIRTAVTGADFVVTTIRVGYDEGRVLDEDIAIKHGVLGQETTGVGGFSMALRTIPVMKEYCQVIKELAPNAWIFNFTNPSGLVTQALRDAGYDRVLGICDAPSSTKINMAEALGIPTSELKVQFAGLNHLSFVTSVLYNGRELLPDLLNDDVFLGKVKEFSMFDPDVIRTMGHMPNEYLYYFFYQNKASQNVQNSQKARGRMVMENNIEMFAALSQLNPDTQIEEMLQTYLKFMHKRESTYMVNETNQALVHKPFDGQIPNAEGYAGVMMNYLLTMATGEEREMVLSIPDNIGHFGLKAGDVMEITCTITKDGINAEERGELSAAAQSLIQSVKAYENLTVEAVNARSVKIAQAALMAHPLIGDYPLAKALVDDIIHAHKQYLGEWNN